MTLAPKNLMNWNRNGNFWPLSYLTVLAREVRESGWPKTGPSKTVTAQGRPGRTCPQTSARRTTFNAHIEKLKRKKKREATPPKKAAC